MYTDKIVSGSRYSNNGITTVS